MNDSIPTIAPQDLADICKAGMNVDFIDVRTPLEFREAHVAQARNIPLDQLDPAALIKTRIGSTGEPLYLICRSGSRGRQACEKFLAAGFANVINVAGGTMACEQVGCQWFEARKPSRSRGKCASRLDQSCALASFWAGSFIRCSSVFRHW